MPELPEVETVRRTLEPLLLDRVVRRVTVRRPDVIRGGRTPRDLLRGGRFVAIERHGKELALLAEPGPRCVCIHLGMTGSLRHRPPGDDEPHTHVTWHLDDGQTLAFRDPRRFGGIWPFDSPERRLAQRWHRLGSDALTITPAALHARLTRTGRPIKAALLDQTLVAGLGNIYVDELLFACGLHPLQPAAALNADHTRRLVRHMRTLLTRAIAHGGSTLRDYVDGRGQTGGYQHRHQIYGRAGHPCRRCGTSLTAFRLQGRTTVYCQYCQITRQDAAGLLTK